ncbi:hypothetical protein Ae201684P_011430 [Aphanomyces euteiches]|uniref:Mitochondrial carrier protein n=1 Tax=Aphanomyces euteiches TaxID=100861 RepID=A0A6G0XXL5_9STRA|nr:hypothetical protein Ae201684_000487 [Aphanomyces euteiches]KAH9091887.1 hypothetical protein Ae201684P_011430 [Aphanomyces euteiches]KAH9153062.1 hypothetical protein AeRB84_004624 [Aphanomyces euteiches]
MLVSPSTMDKVETVLTSFVGGTVAGVTGAIVGYPFDTIKSRIQTQMHLPSSSLSSTATPLQAFVHSIRQEGFLSLYRGASTQVARSAIGCSILFGLMAQFKWLFSSPPLSSQNVHPDTVLVASAACTGMVEASIYCPFEITMIRMQTQATNSQTTWQCATNIYARYGLRQGLYRGFIPTCCREMVGNTVYFLTYERLKDSLKAKTDRTDMEIFGISGAVAGLVYWCVSFPLDTIKSVVQADALEPKERKYRGFGDCAKQLYAEGQAKRFFRGLSPCLIRAMPVNAVQFMSYEKSMEVLMPLWPKRSQLP